MGMVFTRFQPLIHTLLMPETTMIVSAYKRALIANIRICARHIFSPELEHNFILRKPQSFSWSSSEILNQRMLFQN